MTVASFAMIITRRSGHFRQARDRSRRGSAAPLLIHFVRGVQAELEELRFRIDQLGDAFAGRQAAFLVLRFDGFRPAALANPLFLVLDFGEPVDHATAVFLEGGRLRVDLRFDDCSAHPAPSATAAGCHWRCRAIRANADCIIGSVIGDSF